MKNTFFILQKELYSYFASAIAYVIMATFLIFSGLIFYSNVSLPVSQQGFAVANESLRAWFEVIGFVMLFLGAILTTRLIAEEQRNGTLELLFTSPVRSWEVVLGKFLAVLVLFMATLALTLYYPLATVFYGASLDVGPVVAGYLGLILEGGVFFAIGLFASALTYSQVIAAVLSLIINLLLYLLGGLLTTSNLPNWLGDAINFISLPRHMTNFAKGVIDGRDVVYFLSLIILFLYATAQAIATRRAA